MSHHAVMQACRLGDLTRLRATLTREDLTVAEPGTGWTPLYCAGVFGHAELVEFLLEQGADPNVVASNGDSLLHFTVDSGQHRICTLLLEAFANPNPSNNGRFHIDEDTPLHHAAAKGDLKTARILVRFKADVSLGNQQRRTPLHLAVLSGHPSLASFLVLSGASPNAVDAVSSMQEGVRPIDLCKTQEMTESLVQPRKSTPSLLLWNPSPDPRDDSPAVPQTTSPHSSVHSNPSPLPDLHELRSLELKIKRLESINRKIKDSLKTSTSAYSSPESSARVNHKPERLSTPEGIVGDNGKMLTWLAALRLESMYPTLVDSGFDDFGQLLMQMKSDQPLTEELLETVGVSKQGCRAVFLTALERECSLESVNRTKQEKRSQGHCCHSQSSTSTVHSFPPLASWLSALGLSHLQPHFESAGYLEVEQLLFLMHSHRPVTDSTLAGIGIEKVGYRHRILCKLREDAENFDPRAWPEATDAEKKDRGGCVIA